MSKPEDNSNAGSPENGVKATLMTGSKAAGPYEGQFSWFRSFSVMV